MLKEDAVPTIFAHNATKQPQKRRSSILREQKATKKQLRDDAFSHNEMVNNIEFEFNTKAIQTELKMISNSTQTILKPVMMSVSTQVSPIDLMNTREASTQCYNEMHNDIDENIDSESDYEAEATDESVYSVSDESESDIKSTITLSPSKTAFIIYWSSLMILFKKCQICFLPASVKNITVKGSQLIVRLVCSEKHEYTWKSQPSVKRYPQGNLTLAVAVLFSANTFQKISTLPIFNG